MSSKAEPSEEVKKLDQILLIDDDKMVNFLNKAIIQRENVANEILEYEYPEEALHYLEKICKQDNSCPDLIFLDINMPRIDGWEFMERYRSMSSDCKNCIIIMLTSSIDPSDERRAQETEGITGYRSKPLTSEMIDEIVSQYF